MLELVKEALWSSVGTEELVCAVEYAENTLSIDEFIEVNVQVVDSGRI